ncbi:MAG TPA: DUF1343 domain-containing protein [Tepiditoga sp.]|nr:DUF1343 domain-containing protein [Thermotogota bacterium]HOO74340.1 DUF1343 domain-containing protein [Tepiditoga sp.]
MVLQGIDVFLENEYIRYKDKKIGLIINFSFVTADMRDALGEITEKLNIVKIFTPEHGLYGLPDGKEYSDSIHPLYKIPVISLYGENKKPSAEMLEGIDCLIYDIQDVGLRFYTFIYTLAYCLEAASENGKEFVVLDRINPLGRTVQGNRIKYNSFVGGYKLPVRYGLTPGELAGYYVKLMNLRVSLKVIKCKNYNGEAFPETGLKWNVPSPNLPEFSNVIAYSGNCFFEGTNFSEGRGTTKPFLYIGAPWLDNGELFSELNKKNIPVRKREFIPLFSKYSGELCHGIEFFPDENNNFIKISFFILRYLTKYDEFEFNERIKTLSGFEKEEIINFTGFSGEELEEYKTFCKDILIYNKELKTDV